MNAEPLMGLVALASYAAISSVVSAAVAVAWRSGTLEIDGQGPADRARRLWWWRIAPSTMGVFATAALVLPSHARFEEAGGPESPGPMLLGLAALGALMALSALARATALAIETRLVWNHWMAAAAPWSAARDLGAPAFVVDGPGAMVALVGIFRPALVAARAVVDACGGDEVAGIVAHERRHIRAHDNLRRWLMASAPDVLRWSPVHDEMTSAWSDAAEDAADDEAAGEAPRRRAALAELLVKVARLSARAPMGITSPLVGARGLDRRVRRLLDPPAAVAPRSSTRPAALLVAVTIAGAIATSAGPMAEAVHEVVEAVVSFGR